MGLKIGLGISATAGSGAAIPSWASGMDLWRDFVTNRGTMVNPTDTHAETIYMQNASGVWVSKATNVLCREDGVGLQTTPTRTNSIRNNSMVGAVAGTPGTNPNNWSRTNFGGTTSTIVGFGIDTNGLPYIDVRVNGTVSGGGFALFFEAVNGIAATSGQTFTQSMGLAIVGGSIANISNILLAVDESNSSSVYLATQSSSDQKSVLTSSFQRVQSAKTMAQATCAFARPYLNINASASAVIDITLRIWAPQYELGAFASAPILTTSAAVTTTGNQQSVDMTGLISAGVAGIIQVHWFRLDATQFLNISNGSTSNRLFLSSTGGTLRMFVASGGATVADMNGGTMIVGVNTVAFACSQDYFNARVVGQAAVGPDTGGALPVGMNLLGIGGRGYATDANVYALTKKIALKFGTQNQASFDAMYAKAVLAAA